MLLPGGGYALPGLRNHLSIRLLPLNVGPRKRSAAGQGQRARSGFLCRVAATPDPAYGPCDLSLICAGK
ncbi:hypothetical protein LNO04_05890 [Klebsiella pneumoniae subsp. pneumoniae]|nr:hypothetical protein [Klebsiella pneumoniae subsp. pneumoniae]